jgi:hypothetical protein
VCFCFVCLQVRKCKIFILLRRRILIRLKVIPRYFHPPGNVIKGNSSVYNIVVGEEPADCSG